MDNPPESYTKRCGLNNTFADFGFRDVSTLAARPRIDDQTVET